MPSITPISRFADMTPEREKAIDTLLEKVKKEFDPLPAQLLTKQALDEQAVEACNGDEEKLKLVASTKHNFVRMWCYAFLTSRQWDVEKAFEMLREVCEYRKKYSLDKIAVLPPAVSTRGLDEEYAKAPPVGHGERPRGRLDRIAKAVDDNVHFGLHYHDRWGQPVLYLMLGTVDEAGLLKDLKSQANIGQKTADVMFEYVQHMFGVGEVMAADYQHRADIGELAKDGTDASEGLIQHVTIVVDCKGFNYGLLWKPAIDLFMTTMKSVFKYYPDCVHRILVVNSPGMIMFAYNVVKGAFDQNFRKKISFLYPDDTAEALQVVIDPKYIPKFLGGECECEGGCIAGYDRENPKKSKAAAGDDGDVKTENITIKAGKEFHKIFQLQKDECVAWEFASTSGHDIAFSVFFVPQNKASEVNLKRLASKEINPFAVSEGRPTEGADQYEAADAGTLILQWSNKSSWLTAKTIQMKVFKQAGDSTAPTPTSSVA